MGVGERKREKIPVFILVCTHLGQIISNTIYVVEQSQWPQHFKKILHSL